MEKGCRKAAFFRVHPLSCASDFFLLNDFFFKPLDFFL